MLGLGGQVLGQVSKTLLAGRLIGAAGAHHQDCPADVEIRRAFENHVQAAWKYKLPGGVVDDPRAWRLGSGFDDASAESQDDGSKKDKA